jgi:hypothetical protein
MVFTIHISTYLRHRDSPTALSIFHNTFLEIGVCVHFDQPFLQKIHIMIQCLYTTCVVAEKNVQAGLTNLTAVGDWLSS